MPKESHPDTIVSGFESFYLVAQDRAGLVEQASDEGTLAVINAADGREAEQVLG